MNKKTLKMRNLIKCKYYNKSSMIMMMKLKAMNRIKR